MFTPEWWHGYPPREARELGEALGRLRQGALADDEDCRTPWERGAASQAIVDYEMDHLVRSAAYLRRLGWLEPQAAATHPTETP